MHDLTVGFIGLGIMGKPMSLNLINAGYKLNVYNRNPEKTKPLTAVGATAYTTPKEIAQNSNIIITIVSDTPDVVSVILGENGVIEGIQEGAVVIDMSTISPDEVRHIYGELSKKGAQMLDAPVSGGEHGAVSGNLTIMVGGDESAFEKAVPLFDVLGKKTTYMGKSGSGQITKICNQVISCLTLLGVGEGLMLASKEGLDLEKCIGALSGGSAQSAILDVYGPKIAKDDYEPGFFLELMQKDLRIASDIIRKDKLSLPGTALTDSLFMAATASGYSKLGHQAMVKALEALNNYKIV